MIRTLDGIARELGAKGFKQYAHNYGNERVNTDDSVADAIYVLSAYRDDERLIDHYNEFRDTIYCEYNSKGYTPYYKTNAFEEQCSELRASGLMATDFI